MLSYFHGINVIVGISKDRRDFISFSPLQGYEMSAIGFYEILMCPFRCTGLYFLLTERAGEVVAYLSDGFKAYRDLFPQIVVIDDERFFREKAAEVRAMSLCAFFRGRYSFGTANRTFNLPVMFHFSHPFCLRL